MQVSIRHFPLSVIAERFQNDPHDCPHFTDHVRDRGPADLIMPRLLNLVVAIFLILNGLIGLGLLKWFHM